MTMKQQGNKATVLISDSLGLFLTLPWLMSKLQYSLLARRPIPRIVIVVISVVVGGQGGGEDGRVAERTVRERCHGILLCGAEVVLVGMLAIVLEFVLQYRMTAGAAGVNG
eukprot:scaffold2352_cov153-Ochromonas_danica.AAC.4